MSNDGPQWELSKENAAPLERGRNVKELEKRKQETAEERLQSEKRMQHYERLVETEEDPLIHWLSYIKFHQDAYPSNTHDQFLLMERCTRALIGNPAYANDVRFIRVCVTYADKTQFPGDVFKYLHSQHVGTTTALFWIAWAWVAENKGDYAFAEKVYLKGLAKEAAPLKLLQQRHKQFQRRMSRHWLNTSQQQDEQDPETAPSGRSTLGGLDAERVRRNDRAARPRDQPPTDQTTRTFQDRNAKHHPLLANNSASTAPGSGTGFQIFVEENAHEHDKGGYDLDRSRLVHHERKLETEAERNQENNRAAEAWNARGGYEPRYGAPTSKAPTALSFAIHVDDECVAQQEQQLSKEQADFDRLRRDRDRAFREREGEDMAEKLTKDPMRYIRDPSKLAADIPVEDPTPKASISCGFNKKLLAKDTCGQEQCFEERRMLARFYRLTSQADNFNLVAKDESRMDVDSIEDVDMEGNEEDEVKARVPPTGASRRVLFSMNVSVDSQTHSFILNASTASSTVNERDAVGLVGAKEEETINTKFAMRELSMMFSSPAMGLGDSNPPAAQRPRLNEGGDIADYSMIINGLDADNDNIQCGLSNSLIQEENDENANRAENPHARTNASRSFGTSVLRPVDGEEDDRMLGIPTLKTIVPAFEIFSDQSFEESPADGFEILDDEPDIKPAAVRESGFSIFVDRQAKPAADAFSIFVDHDDDEEETDKKPAAGGFPITVDENDDDEEETDKKPAAIGFPIFVDDDEEETDQKPASKIPFSVFQDDDDGCNSEGAGDTATFSIFGEAMDALNEAGKSKRRTSSMLSMPDSGLQIHINDDDFELYKPGDTGAVLTGYSPAFGDISQIVSDEVGRIVQPSPTMTFKMPEGAVDYIVLHKDDIRSSLRKLDQEARKNSTRRPFSRDSEEMDLGSMLSTRGTVRDLPTQAMPRALRKKTSTQGSEIIVGSKSGVIKHELGRGSYGVVVILETDNADCGVVAVKAQAPTDCLAWEFEVMRRLKERVSPHFTSTPAAPFPFPEPFSFVSLADGGLLGMTAGSTTGMNLVDIVNVYKTCEGGPVPELIAIHYTARMLKHIETLHWHGKILHCDAKPDNWVLMASGTAFDGCGIMLDASDLMLVDFGRSVDLVMCAKKEADPMNVKLYGEATTEDLACVAMRKGYGWSFDIDTFGICASAHVLLYGTHLEIEQAPNRTWKTRKTLRRYWQKELWSEVFDTLLNLDEGSQTAIGSRPGSLRGLRQKLELYLNGKSKELASLLKHQVRILPQTRPGN